MRKDLLTFSVVDIRIITVGRVEGQILFLKRILVLQGEEEGSSYIFPQLLDCFTRKMHPIITIQQGKFSEKLRNRSASCPKPYLLFYFPFYGAFRSVFQKKGQILHFYYICLMCLLLFESHFYTAETEIF